MDYILDNALIIVEKSKDNTSILKLYADQIFASMDDDEGKEDEKNA